MHQDPAKNRTVQGASAPGHDPGQPWPQRKTLGEHFRNCWVPSKVNNCIHYTYSFVEYMLIVGYPFRYPIHVTIKNMLHTITCLSIFKTFNLSHRYVLSYVNILKCLPDTYYTECLIMPKVTVYNRQVNINCRY